MSAPPLETAAPRLPGLDVGAPAVWRRAVFLAPAGAALLVGLDAAAMLLELPAPVTADRLPRMHGMLLVLGFLGTLISLERAVALRHRAGFLAPALLGAGGLLLVTPLPLAAGKVTLLLGSVALCCVYLPLWRRQRDDAVLVQALGSVLAAGAAVLWLGAVPVPTVLPWLVGFVVLTISGERAELARLAMGPSADRVLVALSSALVGGVVAALLWPRPGHPLLAAALLTLVGWLASHDVAWNTVRASGQPRFAAACMLAGYGWLAVAGGIWLLDGRVTDGATYDAVVHAVFLGFTMSMVMAHAPVILPAILRRPLPYRPAMYAPAVLLHLSLVVRLYAGDALGGRVAWQLGGVLNIVALLGFVVVAAWSATRRPGPRAACAR